MTFVERSRLLFAIPVMLTCLVTGVVSGQRVLWCMLIFSLLLVGAAGKAMEGGR